jgi:hypothetical protein
MSRPDWSTDEGLVDDLRASLRRMETTHHLADWSGAVLAGIAAKAVARRRRWRIARRVALTLLALALAAGLVIAVTA